MQQSHDWLATRLLNGRVRNSAGEDLGKIEDLAIDPETGRIQYAILSFGGLLGVGDRLFPIPWSQLTFSLSGNYALVEIDKETLRHAPSFERDAWPPMAEAVWRRNIDDHYGRARPAVHVDHVDRRVPVPARRGLSLTASVLLICLALGLVWMTYLVSTRGLDQTTADIKTSLQSAAYAAKETSQAAALTTKVKTALSLSKTIPSDNINVDSEGDVVTLRGEVASADIRQMAESIARDVPGVSEVRNHLFVISQTP
jgi:sporulation protein YlmC with PRC-barrel domain